LSSHDVPSVDHEILWILVGSKGGQTRARILEILSEKPMNANQLAETLELNYHTITYNMDVLVKSRLVVVEGPRYGQVYYPSKIFTSNIDAFKKIITAAAREKSKENHPV
jgi:predicted ArsR family transcriptional regulator